MSEIPNIDELRDHVEALHSLLKDPHPCLATWNLFYAQAISAICEFWNKDVADRLIQEEIAWVKMAERLDVWADAYSEQAFADEALRCRIRAKEIHKVIVGYHRRET